MPRLELSSIVYTHGDGLIHRSWHLPTWHKPTTRYPLCYGRPIGWADFTAVEGPPTCMRCIALPLNASYDDLYGSRQP